MTLHYGFNGLKLRAALEELPETSAWETLNPPKPSEIYIPDMHRKALSVDVTIVEGMRGAGKSFWTAVLASDDTRNLVAKAADVQRLSNTVVKIGFCLDPSNQDFPNSKSIVSMLAKFTPDCIWRAVLVRHLLKVLLRPLPFQDNFVAATEWTGTNPEEANLLLADCDRTLAEQGRILLLLFDSLDRLADDWNQIRKLLSAALKLGLECRSRRSIRFKFFLRPDMIEEEDEIWRFSDSSKLLHGKVELAWRPNDLFGLIVLYLANLPGIGAYFRDALAGHLGAGWREVEGVFSLPVGLTSSEQPLRGIVEGIAGPWVGKNPKRGFTYTWVPTHLSDARRRLSPRNILLAFRRAAEFTRERHPDYPLALHYEGIQQGVVAASNIRISEIKEDYPWVGPLLNGLKGVTVPLSLDEIGERWTNVCIQDALNASKHLERLPPRRYSSLGSPSKDPQRGCIALLDDLVELAVFYKTDDGRYNMPDIFRVGFGILRKGGVRPPR